MLLFFFHREQPPRYVVAQRSAMVESALFTDDGSLFARCVPGDTILRLSHNPTIPSDEIQSGGTSRIALHIDFGHITLPFQDSVGGLELEDRANTEPNSFLPLPPTDTVEIIINVDDTSTH